MHLERLSFILVVVGQMGEATVAEICAHSDLPKPSAYRLVQDLVSVGLLEPVTRGTFSIGSRLKRITQSDHSDRALLEVIAPALKKAATQYGVAFFLSRLRGKSVEIIHVETPNTGVSVAAFLPELLLTSDIEGRLRAYTEFTLTNVNDLEAEFETIRKRGFAECVEEIERGLCSVAAPLAPSGPGAAMSIGAAGSVRVFTPAFRDKLGARIARIARDVSANLGWDVTADAKLSG